MYQCLWLTNISDFLEDALDLFSGKPCYKPEKARTLHKIGLLFQAEGKKIESEAQFKRASDVYREVKKSRSESQSKKRPVEADYNSLVTFWSR